LVGKGRKITAVKVAKLSRLAYCHFHLFLHLKKHLGGQIFHEDEEVKKGASTCFCALAALFYDTGIQTFAPRLNKCPQKVTIVSKKGNSSVFRFISLVLVN
jgi:hypothetical protein